VPWTSRLARWGRRHKLAATGAAVLLLTAVVALAVSTALLGREQRRTEEQRELAMARSQEANERAEALDRQAYVYRVNLAYRECLANNIVQAERHLDGCPEGRRGWEWAYCRRLCHMESLRIGGAASPAGLQSDVAFSPDGTTVVTAGVDGMVHFWDANTGKEQRSFRAHPKAVLGLAFGPDGLLATGSEGEVNLWEANTGRQLHSLRGPAGWARSVRFSPDGRRLAAGFGTQIRAGRPPQVIVWDTQTGRELASLRESNWGLLALAFSPDSRQIATMTWFQTSLRFWDATTGQLSRADDVGEVGGGFELAYRPDGRVLAVACRDGSVLLWDTTAHKVSQTFRGHSGVVNAVTFSPDGRLVASGSLDGAIKVWDAATGREVASFRGHTGEVVRVGFSPDGTRLASQGDDGVIRLWEVSTEPDVLTLRGNLGWAFRTAFSPDGRRLVIAGFDIVRVRDAQTGETLVSIPFVHGGVQGLALSPDGRQVACSSEFAKDCDLYDTATGRHLATFRGHSEFVRCVAFSPDGSRVASAGDDHTVRLWDAATGREVLTLRGHTGGVFGVAFSPDGRRLASMSWDDTVRLWDAATGQEAGSFPGAGRGPSTSFGNVLAFSPDGRLLASIGPGRTIVIRDAESGGDLLTLAGHTRAVNSVAFSPDGRRVLSAGEDNTVKIWDAATAEEVFTLRGHTNGVLGIAISPDGTRIASASMDMTVHVWESALPEPALVRRRWLLAQAEPLVESLLHKPLLKEEVIERLRGDAALAEPVRAVALQLAERAVEYPVLLNNASWAVVLQPQRVGADYEQALRLAERACRLQPDVRSFQNTLGAAQYRLTRYPEARLTLTRIERLNMASSATSGPVSLAFLTMVHHRLGKHAEARAYLGRLREAIQKAGGPSHPDVKAILHEAETLIEAPAPQKGE
jgi:WD40 repeat protein